MYFVCNTYDIVGNSTYQEYFLEHDGVIGFIMGQMLRLIFDKIRGNGKIYI